MELKIWTVNGVFRPFNRTGLMWVGEDEVLKFKMGARLVSRVV